MTAPSSGRRMPGSGLATGGTSSKYWLSKPAAAASSGSARPPRDNQGENARRSTERGSSVGGSLARRRGVRRQDQLRIVDDVADITVVADEADPAGRPFQPHQVAGL